VRLVWRQVSGVSLENNESFRAELYRKIDLVCIQEAIGSPEVKTTLEFWPKS
jgi:hypothetical protein